MLKLNNNGSLIIPLVIVGLLLFTSLGFGYWAYAGRQDYKNNVDTKIAEAVEVAEEKLDIEKEADFAERFKLPNKNYQGPDTLGSLNITYPKTWSAYIVESNSTIELNGFLHPDYVPDIRSDTSFAFRFEIVNTNYDQVLKTYDAKVKLGKIKVEPYRLAKVDSALGTRLIGEIDIKKEGVLVLLPIRDKTIKVWTEGQNFKGDFETILTSLTYNL